jgi:hypothetical protein
MPTSGTLATVTQITPIEYDAGNSGASLTFDFVNGYAQKTVLTANSTFTFSNPVNGATYLLRLVQDGTGSRTVTFPSTVKWSGGTAPTLTTAASKTDLIICYYGPGIGNGIRYLCNSILNYTE